MKRIGYVMITVGFLAGAAVSVLDKTEVKWGWFAVSMAIGIGGVVIVRVVARMKASVGETFSLNMRNVNESLESIFENIRKLNAEKNDINTYDVRYRIDELFSEDILKFVDSRKSIAVKYGVQAYADVMSHFAAGERYLNRVWSASADGYIDEVNEYLDKTERQFAKAFENITELSGHP